MFNDIDSDEMEKFISEIPNRHLYYPEMGRLDIRQMDYKYLLPLVSRRNKYIQEGKGITY